MLNLPLSLVIEALVAVLLVITIGYCMLLNGRLKRLRADEEGLRATIAELLTTTEIAERAIHGLRATSSQCDEIIGQRLVQARQASDDLAGKLTAASAVVERIGKITGAAGQGTVVAELGMASAPRQDHSRQEPQRSDSPSRRLDDAARALQDRLQRVAS